MPRYRERGLCELYQDDPGRADRLVFERAPYADRRGFLRGAGLAAMTAAVGAAIPFHRLMPAGLIPAAFAETTADFLLRTKDGLVVLNDRPVNAETPAHLLDDDVTPNSLHFVRNNGLLSDSAIDEEAGGWTLAVDGEVETPLKLTLDELKSRFDAVTLKLQLECGGNGRAGFNPPVKGNQWSLGAVGNAEWTGVRAADIFNAAGLKDSAVYTGYYGSDLHPSGDPDKVPISRGAPIAKMMDPHTLIAFAMNGDQIPPLHGFPVRIVAPGWPGSVSGKWVHRIWVRDRVHDGTKMGPPSYQVPRNPVPPGAHVDKADFRIIESMPVKSLISFPESGQTLPAGTMASEIRGHAWAGDNAVGRVDLSIDFGSTWQQTTLSPPPNPYAWQRWRRNITFPSPGYYEIWARATDDAGNVQPFAVNWNPKGYLNNAMPRIAITVTG